MLSGGSSRLRGRSSVGLLKDQREQLTNNVRQQPLNANDENQEEEEEHNLVYLDATMRGVSRSKRQRVE